MPVSLGFVKIRCKRLIPSSFKKIIMSHFYFVFPVAKHGAGLLTRVISFVPLAVIQHSFIIVYTEKSPSEAYFSFLPVAAYQVELVELGLESLSAVKSVLDRNKFNK